MMKYFLFSMIMLSSVTAAWSTNPVVITLTADRAGQLSDADLAASLEAAGETRTTVTGIKLASAAPDVYWGLDDCKKIGAYFDKNNAPALTTLDLSVAAFSGDSIPNNNATGSSTFGQSTVTGEATNGMGITTAILPDNLISVGARVFYKCTTLTHINLPNGLKNIGTGAFQNTDVELAALPESLEVLGGSAFTGCKKVTFSSLPKNLKSLAATYIFSDCSEITISRIPDKITTIPNYAFRNCKKITEMTFPAGLASIGQYAFSGTPLTKITFLGVNPPAITAGSNTASFSNVDQIDVIVPAGTPLDGGSPWLQAPWTSFKSVTEAINSSLSPAGVSEKGIAIHPAVATSEILLSGNSSAPVIRIYNVAGREVLTVNVSPNQDNVISVAQLAPGVYLLKAGETTLKFIKK
jgi:hypothetical protein